MHCTWPSAILQRRPARLFLVTWGSARGRDMLDLGCRKHCSAIIGRSAARYFDRVIHSVLFQFRRPGDGRLVPRALVGEHVLGRGTALVQAAGQRRLLLTLGGLFRGLLS